MSWWSSDDKDKEEEKNNHNRLRIIGIGISASIAGSEMSDCGSAVEVDAM